MGRFKAFNLPKWIAENRAHLKPPVGNKLLYAGEFKVMIVAGPNSRTDYHVEAGEEWYYMLEGRMTLKVVDDGEFYDVPLGPGDTFCLPAGVPHSPQREANSLGIVVERERRPGDVDAMQWYCPRENCRALLHRAEFFCRDLEKDLPPVIRDYFGDEKKRSCKKCDFVEAPVNRK